MTVLARARVILTGDTVQLTRSLQGASAAMEQAGRKMTRMGRSLSLRVTAPLVAIGAAATKMGADFEAEMSKIVGLVGVAQDQVDAWGKEILDLAPQLAAAPRELAEGLFFVTSAGFRGAEAMEVLEQAGRASAAGLGDIATIADAVTSAVNAYGQENLAAGRATDILTAAVREGKLEAESLAPVLGNLLPTASAMGIEFDQVAGTLAVFSRTGADATSGATSLRAIMSTLQKPSNEARKAIEGAGASMGQLREMAAGPGGLIEVMRFLERSFGDNEEALAQIFPNVRAFRGVMNALAQDADIVDGVMQGVADSTGAADHAFETAADTARFRMKQTMVELQVVMLRLADLVLPLVADMFERLGGVIRGASNFLRDLPRPLQVTAIGLVAAAAAAGPLLIIFGQLTIAATALTKAFIAMKGVALASWFVGVGKAVAGAAVAGKGLVGVLAALKVAIGPAGWVVLGLTAAAGALGVWIRRTMKANEETRKAEDRLTGYAKALDEWTDAARRAEQARLDEAVRSQRQELERLEKELGGAGKAISEMERRRVPGAARIAAREEEERIRRDLDAQRQLVQRLEADHDAVTAAIARGGSETSKLRQELDDLVNGFDLSMDAPDAVREALKDLEGDLRSARRQSELLGDEFDLGEAEAAAYGRAVEALAATSVDLDTAIGSNGETLRDLAGAYIALEEDAARSAKAEREARQEREAIQGVTQRLTDRLRENAQMQAMLGDEFDKTAADARAYEEAASALTRLGVGLDTVITDQGESVRDLAARYVELAAEVRESAAAQAEAARLNREFQDPMEKLIAQTARYKELLDQGVISQEVFNAAVEAAEHAFRMATESLNRLEEEMVRVAARGVDAFAAFATGAGDAMRQFVLRALADLARLIARMLVARALLAAFPGVGFATSLAGTLDPTALASGGRFSRQELILVGEKGPELIMPDVGGRVFSAPDTSRMLASAQSGGVVQGGASGGASRHMAAAGAGGLSASEILAAIGPPPGPLSPEVAATHDWYRRLISHALPDWQDRGGDRGRGGR